MRFKTIALLLVLGMVTTSLAACGGGESKKDGGTGTGTTPTEKPAEGSK